MARAQGKRLLSSGGPMKAYKAMVAERVLREDAHQLQALVHLQRLYEEICRYTEHSDTRVSVAVKDAPEVCSPRLA